MIINADCLIEMQNMPENSIDSIVTDPPYGISFMAKKWDYDVPDVDVWREALRLLKPGGHLLAFASPRTYHRMVVNIEDGGFEIRDMVAWVHGQGFPKSKRIQVSDYDGWGTQLKPAIEPIVLARKALTEKTITSNVEKWGVGAINVDACRVDSFAKKWSKPNGGIWSPPTNDGGKLVQNTKGRHPANLIHDGSNEVLKLLPNSKSRKGKPRQAVVKNNTKLLNSKIVQVTQDYDDSGSAARFFYCAKASKKERNGNNHPTVKPIKLMRYLVRLITHPNGTVLDPFMGSGTTGIACQLEDFDFIGIERNKEYFEIAESRLQGRP